MYWLWYFLFCGQPYLIIPAVLGCFGSDAKKAAEDLSLFLTASFALGLTAIYLLGYFGILG